MTANDPADASTSPNVTADVSENTDSPTTHSDEPPSDSSNEVDIDAIGDASVDPGLFDVELTIPAYILCNATQEQLDQLAKDNGYKSATLNSDGSATYVMTKSQHKEMMDGIREDIKESLAEMTTSEDTPSIVKIEANDDYTQYKVFLNTEEVSASEEMSTIALYFYSGMFHVFNGTEPGNVNIQFVNETTGEIIKESNPEGQE